MASLLNNRSVMTLYSDSDVDSHQIRLVLAEKAVPADIVEIDPNENHESLFSLNPYGHLPIFTDRELVLYNTMICMEFLEERFPHPPLLPVYPIERAKMRMLAYRIYKDWYGLYHKIRKNPESAEEYRKELRDLLIQISPVFDKEPYFMGQEYSLLDCIIIPLLWRLPYLKIELSNKNPIIQYANRMFERELFISSLTETEKELR